MNKKMILLFLSVVGSSSLTVGEIKHRFLTVDESAGTINLVDQFNPGNNWSKNIGAKRDLQLIGNNLVLANSYNGGYCKVNIKNGELVKRGTFNGAESNNGGVQSARWLPNGNIICISGHNSDASRPVIVTELDSTDKVKKVTEYKSFSGLRLFRRTPDNTVFFGSGKLLVEGDTSGKILSRINIEKVPGMISQPNVYQAVKLSDGNIMVATGHGANLAIIKPDGTALKTWGGSLEPQRSFTNPSFFAMFQVLDNGHIVVTNCGEQNKSVIEYDTTGKMLWSYSLGRSVNAVLIIDSLDTKYAWDDTYGGVLKRMDLPTKVLQNFSVYRDDIKYSGIFNQSDRYNSLFDLRGRSFGETCKWSGLSKGVYLQRNAGRMLKTLVP